MKKFWFSLFICFPLLSSVSVKADQSDPRLDDLFQQLQNTQDSRDAMQIETLIWQAWMANDKPQFSRLMSQGIEQMNRNAMTEALRSFTRLIEIAPDFAEAWNKRATIYYLLGNYSASEADIVETLMLEPYHFGALSGRGLIYMSKGEYFLARNAFNAALEVNPNMPSVKNNLEALKTLFRNRAI